MAKFLVTVRLFPGHVHLNVAIAHALHSGGHEVAFYTGSRARTAVEGEGFRCFPFQHVDEERIYAALRSGFYYFPTIRSLLRHARELRARLHVWLLATLPRRVEDPEAVLAALSAGVPLVVVPTEWDKPENAQRVVEAGAGGGGAGGLGGACAVLASAARSNLSSGRIDGARAL